MVLLFAGGILRPCVFLNISIYTIIHNFCHGPQWLRIRRRIERRFRRWRESGSEPARHDMSHRILFLLCFALFLAAAVPANASEASELSAGVKITGSTVFGGAGTPVDNATGEDSGSGSSFAAALDSASPPLSVAYRDGQLILEWSVDSQDWVLEQSSSFDLAALWASVPMSMAQTNGTNISLAVSPCVQIGRAH